MSQKNEKLTIIIFTIIIIAFIAYKFLFVDGNSQTSITVDKALAEDLSESQAIITKLNKLRQLTLDDSIFSNSVFASLINFNRSVQEQVAGRSNPFLPIGIDR